MKTTYLDEIGKWRYGNTQEDIGSKIRQEKRRKLFQKVRSVTQTCASATCIFSVPAFLAKLKKQRKGLKWWLWEVVVIGGPAVRAFIRTF